RVPRERHGDVDGGHQHRAVKASRPPDRSLTESRQAAIMPTHREDPVVQRVRRCEVAASRLGVILFAGTILVLPSLLEAWPAVQDVTGVHLCNSRPLQRPDGQWECRSGAVLYEGNLVDVTQGPARPGYGPYPYGRPYGRPPQEPSGYDALDPWLGHSE